MLTDKLADVSTSLNGDSPAVADNLWLGADESAAVASALLPKLEKTKQEIGQLLFEVVQLEVRVGQLVNCSALGIKAQRTLSTLCCMHLVGDAIERICMSGA